MGWFKRWMLLFFLVANSFAAEKAPVQMMLLPGGLHLYHLNKPQGSELADIAFLIQAGSADETRKQAGIAHLLEHIIFQTMTPRGTPLVEYLMNNGLDINGSTGPFHTAYSVTGFPVQDLQKVLSVWCRALFDPVYPDEHHFRMEQQVVLEEIRYRSTPDIQMPFSGPVPHFRLLIDKLLDHEDFLKWYPGGFERSVAGFDRSEVREFQQRNYFPGNADLIIASPLDDKEVKDLVLRILRKLPESVGERNITPSVKIRKARKFRFYSSPNTTQEDIGLLLGFIIAPEDEFDGFLADMLANLLNYRLRIFEDRRYSLQFDTVPSGRGSGPRVMAVSCRLNHRNTRGAVDFPVAEEALMCWIHRAVAAPFPAEEVSGMIYRARLARARRSGAVELAGSLEHGSLERFDRFDEWADAVTPEALQRAARQIFNFDQSVMIAHGQGRYLYELQSMMRMTLVVACGILPVLLLIGLHFSLTQWFEDGSVVLYLVRPLIPARLILERIGSFALLNILILSLGLGMIQVVFLGFGQSSGWQVWSLFPYISLILVCVTGIQTGLMLLTGRSGLALVVSLMLLGAGNFSLQILDVIQGINQYPIFRRILEGIYWLIPKIDQIQDLALQQAMNIDAGSVTGAALVQIAVLTVMVVLAGIVRFMRRETG